MTTAVSPRIPTPLRPLSIAAVDDVPVLLSGLRATLESRLTIAEYISAPTVKALLAMHPDPDVVLLDIRLNDDSSPADNVRRLIRTLKAPVLLFSQEARPSVVQACLSMGAQGLLEKNASPDTLAEAITTVADGEPWLTQEWAAIVADTQWIRPRLSPGERQALEMYAAGLLIPSIARRMEVSVETVKTELKRVRKKYADAGRPAPNRTELYIKAVEDGIFEPPEPH